MPRTRVISRFPVVSRVVMMMAASLVAVSAAVGLPDDTAPGYSTVAQVSDSSPDAPPSVAKKCKSSGKKGCKKKVSYSDADLKNLSNDDVEAVAALGTVLAIIALAAVI